MNRVVIISVILFFVGVLGLSSVFVYGQTVGNWTSQTSGITSYIFSIQFVGKEKGFGVSNSGIFINTLDGGKTWTKSTIGTSFLLTDVYFLNDKVGWSTGIDGIIYKTIDGGATWTTKKSAINSQNSEYLGKIAEHLASL